MLWRSFSRASTMIVPIGNSVEPGGGTMLMYWVRGPSTSGVNVPSSGGPSLWTDVQVRNGANWLPNAMNVPGGSPASSGLAAPPPHAATSATTAHATTADEQRIGLLRRLRREAQHVGVHEVHLEHDRAVGALVDVRAH